MTDYNLACVLYLINSKSGIVSRNINITFSSCIINNHCDMTMNGGAVPIIYAVAQIE